MRALVYRFSPGGWLAARHLGGHLPGLAVAASGLRLLDISAPVAPGPDWAGVRVRLAGVCGTDVATLRGRSGPQLSPFVSFPAVMGHEVLGVAEDGPYAGQRVVLDPFLPCRTRGLPACPACAAGQTAICQRFAEGDLAPGMLLGFCRDLPGGWTERLMAHNAQLHAVPDGLPDETAVLAEPLAVALHAVYRDPPPSGARVLVVGAGTVGLCLVAAMRLLETGAEIAVVARHPRQRELAAALGADEVLAGSAEAERLALRRGWGGVHAGLLGTRGFSGGFDQVYDAAGSASAVATALRLTRAGGRAVLLGCSGVVPRCDLTAAWAHELRLEGFCGYGAEPAAGGRHTIDLALGLMAAHPDVPVGSLVTHRFPLGRYREALKAAFFHRGSGSVKILLHPDGQAGNC